MDEAVDQVMGRSSDEKGADKAVAIRRAQQKERVRLQSEIQAEQKTITTLSEESAPLRAEFRKVEAEVGPIKYIAALIYGDAASQNMLEAAVRWVIILIVVVFDPLALTLILAANKQLEWARRGKGGWIHDEEDRPVEEKPAVVEPAVADAEPIVEKVTAETTPTEPVVEPEHPLTEEEREAQEMEAVERFFWRGRMIAKALDAEEAERTAQEGNAQLAEIQPESDVDAMLESLQAAKDEEARLVAEAQQQQELLDTLATEFEALSNTLADERTRRADIEAELANAEQIKSDLQVAYESTAVTAQTLTTQKTELTQELTDANNKALTYKLQLDKSKAEIDKLASWVDQLQTDLRAAIGLAQERNNRLNELEAQLNPPQQVFVEELIQEVLPIEPAVVPDAEPDTVYDPNVGFEERYFSHRQNFGVQADGELPDSGVANFGNEFPAEPNKGDVYLRTDYLPGKLFKWNGTKWIEIDKNTNDRLAYNRSYIEHLIVKMRSGEYDFDDLSPAEQQEIEEYLKNQNASLQ
jgi:predicted nuclease with TOPRIM domain